MAMLACLLTYYGNALGRRYFVELDGRQFPKLFTCLIGRTAKGRKFTADANACRMMDAISPLAELFRHTGLSTGEGLIKTLLDHKDGMLLQPAVFQEGEFASVIRRKERRGNSLDDVLRNAWDDTALGTTTRADPLRAVGSTFQLIVHITPDELKRLLSACDLTIGFANRFLVDPQPAIAAQIRCTGLSGRSWPASRSQRPRLFFSSCASKGRVPG